MYDGFLTLISRISDLMMGTPTMIFIAFVYVFLTVRARFFQATSFVYILRSTFGQIFDRSGDRHTARITPFQATATSLAGTVGMGNMVGVATALSIGGPGAIFWMWVLAFFGMITKAAEITLAVHYRDVDEHGQVQGGPMFYIRKALGWNSLAVLFSIGVTINCFFSSSLLQAHSVGRAFNASYGLNPYLVTGAMAIVTAVVAIGGVRRIGRFCVALVPFMTVRPSCMPSRWAWRAACCPTKRVSARRRWSMPKRKRSTRSNRVCGARPRCSSIRRSSAR